jgi:hypothetical protein
MSLLVLGGLQQHRRYLADCPTGPFLVVALAPTLQLFMDVL